MLIVLHGKDRLSLKTAVFRKNRLKSFNEEPKKTSGQNGEKRTEKNKKRPTFFLFSPDEFLNRLPVFGKPVQGGASFKRPKNVFLWPECAAGLRKRRLQGSGRIFSRTYSVFLPKPFLLPMPVYTRAERSGRRTHRLKRQSVRRSVFLFLLNQRFFPFGRPVFF